LEKLDNLIDKIKSELEQNNQTGYHPEFDTAGFEKKFKEVMDDDFNTSQAVAVIFDFVKEANKTIANHNNISSSFMRS